MGKLNTAVLDRSAVASVTSESKLVADVQPPTEIVTSYSHDNSDFIEDALNWEDVDDDVDMENAGAAGTDVVAHAAVDTTTTEPAEAAIDPVAIAAETPLSAQDEPVPQPQPVIAEPVIAEPATAEPVSSEPVQPLDEIEWDEEDEKRKDEREFFKRLKELNVEITEAEEALDEAKEQVKLAKATHNLAVACLQNFASKGVQYRKKPQPKPPETKVAVSETKVAKSETNTPVSETSLPGVETTAPIIEPGDWRSMPTRDVVDGVEGLGKKKLEALVDEFPTLGKLEDARGEASKDFKPFKSVLPRGFGEELASRIESRMLESSGGVL